MAEPGKIYTRTGDGGFAAALDGKRRPKSDSLFRALGTLEELCAALGSAAADPSMPEEIRADLHRIQSCLFVAGAAMAGSDPAASSGLLRAETAWLESRIDSMQTVLPPLGQFILPGGSPAGAAVHLGRTICRRAEIEAVAHCIIEAQIAATEGAWSGSSTVQGVPSVGLDAESPVCLPGRIAFLSWINRLSDALFVMARTINAQAGVMEEVWTGKAPDGKGHTR